MAKVHALVLWVQNRSNSLLTFKIRSAHSHLLQSNPEGMINKVNKSVIGLTQDSDQIKHEKSWWMPCFSKDALDLK